MCMTMTFGGSGLVIHMMIWSEVQNQIIDRSGSKFCGVKSSDQLPDDAMITCFSLMFKMMLPC